MVENLWMNNCIVKNEFKDNENSYDLSFFWSIMKKKTVCHVI